MGEFLEINLILQCHDVTSQNKRITKKDGEGKRKKKHCNKIKREFTPTNTLRSSSHVKEITIYIGYINRK